MTLRLESAKALRVTARENGAAPLRLVRAPAEETGSATRAPAETEGASGHGARGESSDEAATTPGVEDGMEGEVATSSVEEARRRRRESAWTGCGASMTVPCMAWCSRLWPCGSSRRAVIFSLGIICSDRACGAWAAVDGMEGAVRYASRSDRHTSRMKPPQL